MQGLFPKVLTEDETLSAIQAYAKAMDSEDIGSTVKIGSTYLPLDGLKGIPREALGRIFELTPKLEGFVNGFYDIGNLLPLMCEGVCHPNIENSLNLFYYSNRAYEYNEGWILGKQYKPQEKDFL